MLWSVLGIFTLWERFTFHKCFKVWICSFYCLLYFWELKISYDSKYEGIKIGKLPPYAVISEILLLFCTPKKQTKSSEHIQNLNQFSALTFPYHFRTLCTQCYRMVNLRYLKKWNTIGNFHDFKPKRSTFWPFFKEKLSKIRKFGDFGCKNQQNLKKIQRSIMIP